MVKFPSYFYFYLFLFLYYLFILCIVLYIMEEDYVNIEKIKQKKSKKEKLYERKARIQCVM